MSEINRKEELNTKSSALSIIESVVSNVSNVLFWFGLFLIVTCNTMYIYQFINVVTCNASFTIGSVCLLIKIITDLRFVKKLDLDILFRIIAIACAYMTYRNTFSHTLLIIVLIVISSKNVDYSKLAKMFLVINASIFICNLAVMLLGLKINRAFETKDISHFRASRYCFGCPHPNGFMGMLIVTICCIIIVYKDKLNNMAIAAISVISAVFFIFTESRSGLLVILAIVFLLFIRNNNIAKTLMKYRFAEKIWGFSVVFMIITGFILNGKRPFVIKLINTFTTRVVAFGKAMKKVGMSPFGKIVSMKYPLDSGIFIAFFSFGIIGFIVLMVLVFKALNQSKDDYYMSVVFVAMCVESLFESGVANIIFVLPLIIGYACMDNKSDNSCEIENHNTYTKVNSIYELLNYAFGASISILLIGQSLLWYVRGEVNSVNEFLVGPNPYKYDVALICIGFIVGILMCFIVRKIRKSN